MIGMFGMASVVHDSGITARHAEQTASRASREARNVKLQIKLLEANLAKALLINEALWEFIKKQQGLRDDDLREKIYQIDMRDGTLDGKNQRSQVAQCPKCNRNVGPRHPACLYCGEVIDDSIFNLT